MRAEGEQPGGQVRMRDENGKTGVIKGTGCNQQTVLLRQDGRDVGNAARESDRAAQQRVGRLLAVQREQSRHWAERLLHEVIDIVDCVAVGFVNLFVVVST